MATVPTVQIETIGYNQVMIVTGVPVEEQAAWRAEVEKAARHDQFAVLFADTATVLGAETVTAALQATMGDQVRADVIAEAQNAARIEAYNTARDAVDPPTKVRAEAAPEAKVAAFEKAARARKKR